MKAPSARTFSPLLLLLLLAAGLPGRLPAAEPAPAAKEAKAEEKTVVQLAGELKPGDTAVFIRQRLGPPDEIKPMSAPTGKAEVWVYRREAGTKLEQIPSNTTMTTQGIGADGKPRTQIVAGPVVYQNTMLYLTDVVELLLYNDAFVVRKQSVQTRRVPL